MTMPMGAYEFDDSGMTPKQALLAWVKTKMPPDITVNNFTTDWNDGRAITALVYTTENILSTVVDPKYLNPSDAVDNTNKAMKDAEIYLKIPRVSFVFLILH